MEELKKFDRWVIYSLVTSFGSIFLALIFFSASPLPRSEKKSDANYERVYVLHCPRVSAYNSEVGQCDADPFITASGMDLRKNNKENVVATNILPLGTRIRIPEYFGDRIFYVEDRMNRRYKNAFDIWMKSKKEALQFGVKKSVRIEIIL